MSGGSWHPALEYGWAPAGSSAACCESAVSPPSCAAGPGWRPPARRLCGHPADTATRSGSPWSPHCCGPTMIHRTDQARRQQRYRRVRPRPPRAPPGREHPPRQARWPLPGSSLAPPTLKHGLEALDALLHGVAAIGVCSVATGAGPAAPDRNRGGDAMATFTSRRSTPKTCPVDHGGSAAAWWPGCFGSMATGGSGVAHGAAAPRFGAVGVVFEHVAVSAERLYRGGARPPGSTGQTWAVSGG